MIPQQLIELIHNSVVKIISSKEQFGTGFFISPKLVVTCAHCIEENENEVSIELHKNGIIKEINAVIKLKVPIKRQKEHLYGYPDLAILEIQKEYKSCVFVNNSINIGDAVQVFGFSEQDLGIDPVSSKIEGISSKIPLLKLTGGLIKTGMSGSPIYNIRTGGICGMVTRTRSDRIDLGGRGLKIDVILSHYKELINTNSNFHHKNRLWINCLNDDQLTILGNNSKKGIVNTQVNLIDLPIAKEQDQHTLVWIESLFNSESENFQLYFFEHTHAQFPLLIHFIFSLLRKFNKLNTINIDDSSLPIINEAENILRNKGYVYEVTEHKFTHKKKEQLDHKRIFFGFVPDKFSLQETDITIFKDSNPKLANQLKSKDESLAFIAYCMLCQFALKFDSLNQLEEDLIRIPEEPKSRIRFFQALYWPGFEATFPKSADSSIVNKRFEERNLTIQAIDSSLFIKGSKLNEKLKKKYEDNEFLPTIYDLIEKENLEKLILLFQKSKVLKLPTIIISFVIMFLVKRNKVVDAKNIQLKYKDKLLKTPLLNQILLSWIELKDDNSPFPVPLEIYVVIKKSIDDIEPTILEFILYQSACLSLEIGDDSTAISLLKEVLMLEINNYSYELLLYSIQLKAILQQQSLENQKKEFLKLDSRLELLHQKILQNKNTNLYLSSSYISGLTKYYLARVSTNKIREVYFSQAASLFDKSSDYTNNKIPFLQLQAETELHANNTQKAIEIINKIPIESRSTESNANLIVALLREGNYAKAIEFLSKLLLDQTKVIHPKILINLGAILLASNDLDESIKAFELARNLITSPNWRLDYLSGIVFQKKGNHEEAEIYLNNALENHTYSPIVYRTHLESLYHQIRKITNNIRFAFKKNGIENDKLIKSWRVLLKQVDLILPEYENTIEEVWETSSLPGNGVANKLMPYYQKCKELYTQIISIQEIFITQKGLNPITIIACINELVLGDEHIRLNTANLELYNFHNETSISQKFIFEGESQIQEKEARLDPLSLDILKRISLSEGNGAFKSQKINLQARKLEIQNSSETLYAYSYSKNIKRKAYQEATVSQIVFNHFGRSLLADEVGLGKTVESLLAMTELITRGLVKRVLIMVPSKFLANQWGYEIRNKFFPYGINRSTELSIGFGKYESSMFDNNIFIITHQAFVRSKFQIENGRWDMIIVDEAHHFRNPRSERYKRLIATPSRYLLLLSATPIQNSLEDLYNLSSLLRPGLLGSLSDFNLQFKSEKKINAVKNVDSLTLKLMRFMVRNSAKSVISDTNLPKKEFHDHSVELNKNERLFYDGIEELSFNATENSQFLYYSLSKAACSSPDATKNMIYTIHKKNPTILSSKLLEMLNREEPLLPVTKLNELKRIISRLKNELCIVFTEYRGTAKIISQIVGGIFIDSGLPQNIQSTIIEDFLSHKREKLLIATPRLAEGVNLQRCSHLINFDIPWNPFKLEQRLGRIHRFGQTSDTVHMYTIAASNTIEDLIRTKIIEKLKLFEAVIGRSYVPWSAIGDGITFEKKLRKLLTSSKNREQLGEEFQNLIDENLDLTISSEDLSNLDFSQAIMRSIDNAIKKI